MSGSGIVLATLLTDCTVPAYFHSQRKIRCKLLDLAVNFVFLFLTFSQSNTCSHHIDVVVILTDKLICFDDTYYCKYREKYAHARALLLEQKVKSDLSDLTHIYSSQSVVIMVFALLCDNQVMET